MNIINSFFLINTKFNTNKPIIFLFYDIKTYIYIFYKKKFKYIYIYTNIL